MNQFFFERRSQNGPQFSFIMKTDNTFVQPSKHTHPQRQKTNAMEHTPTSQQVFHQYRTFNYRTLSHRFTRKKTTLLYHTTTRNSFFLLHFHFTFQRTPSASKPQHHRPPPSPLVKKFSCHQQQQSCSFALHFSQVCSLQTSPI